MLISKAKNKIKYTDLCSYQSEKVSLLGLAGNVIPRLTRRVPVLADDPPVGGVGGDIELL